MGLGAVLGYIIGRSVDGKEIQIPIKPPFEPIKDFEVFYFSTSISASQKKTIFTVKTSSEKKTRILYLGHCWHDSSIWKLNTIGRGSIEWKTQLGTPSALFWLNYLVPQETSMEITNNDAVSHDYTVVVVVESGYEKVSGLSDASLCTNALPASIQGSGSTILLDLLKQGAIAERRATISNDSGAGTLRDDAQWKAKVFSRGCRGFIKSISLRVKNDVQGYAASPSLREYYNTGDDNISDVYGSNWKFQTFTTLAAYGITSVKLKLYRVGSPGTVTVGIRATSAGKPTGSDLTSGTIDGNTLTTDSAGAWYQIALTLYGLSISTMYAIVIRAPSGNDSNKIKTRLDSSSPTYAGGTAGWSPNSGSTWETEPGSDLMFEVYGKTSGPQPVDLPVCLKHSLTSGPVLSFTVTVPTSQDGWYEHTLLADWSYDRCIIILGSVSTDLDIYYDTGSDPDAYLMSDANTVSARQDRRYHIRLDIGVLTIGDTPVSGVINTIAIPNTGAIGSGSQSAWSSPVTITLVNIQGSGKLKMVRFTNQVALGSANNMAIKITIDGSVIFNNSVTPFLPQTATAHTLYNTGFVSAVVATAFARMWVYLELPFQKSLLVELSDPTAGGADQGDTSGECIYEIVK